MLGIGLVTRAKPIGADGDIAALRDIEKRIEDELARLARKHGESIRTNA